VSWWWFPARRRRDLDEEVEAHLRMAVRDRAERGESLAEARRPWRRSSAMCPWSRM
jgi:hypothetical protein